MTPRLIGWEDKRYRLLLLKDEKDLRFWDIEILNTLRRIDEETICGLFSDAAGIYKDFLNKLQTVQSQRER